MVSVAEEEGASVKHTSGTSFATIRLARPSRIAVLPTPGGPISFKGFDFVGAGAIDADMFGELTTGFDFVLRDRTEKDFVVAFLHGAKRQSSL